VWGDRHVVGIGGVRGQASLLEYTGQYLTKLSPLWGLGRPVARARPGTRKARDSTSRASAVSLWRVRRRRERRLTVSVNPEP
jgi:hypothetical protein